MVRQTSSSKPRPPLREINRCDEAFELVAANPYVQVNWASAIDMKTGRPVETEVSKKARAGELVTVWPSAFGGKNWEPMSFNPQTETVYANTLNLGWNYKAIPGEYKVGEFYWAVDLSAGWAWPDGPRGSLKAIDPLTGKAKWENPSDLPRSSGVLSTAGGLVFSGQLTAEFEAFDADLGKSWEQLMIYVSEDFLRKVWRDKIVFRKLNLANPGRVPIGPNAVIQDDLAFTRPA